MAEPDEASREIIVPDVETLIAINVEVAGDEAGVRDRRLIAQAAARPNLGFGGVEAHQGLLPKVAALLHSLASTQGFVNGNKRTAWMAAQGMLVVNGMTMRRVSDAEAEAVVLGVATGAVDVPLLAEWLAETCEQSDAPWGYYRSVVIRLSDIGQEGLIQGSVFESCLLVGPTVLYPEHDVVFAGCHWGGKIDDILWQLEPEVPREVAGAIALRHVRFRWCHFEHVGFTGPPEVLHRLALASTVPEPSAQRSAREGNPLIEEMDDVLNPFRDRD